MTFFDQKELLKSWESPHDHFSVESVFSYFEKLKGKKEHLTIFCDSKTFHFLTGFIGSENSSLHFSKNDLSSFQIKFKKKLIRYRNLDSLIDSKAFELAFYCNKNMIIAEIPSKFTKDVIFSSEVTSLNLSDFNLDYIGSSRKMYEELCRQKAKFREIKDKTNILFFKIANNINSIYLSSIYNLMNLFSTCQTNLSTPQNVSIMKFSTLSSAGNYLLRSKLEKKSLPVLNHKFLSIKFNSSKLEILVVQSLSDLHFLTCKEKDKFYSFVTRDGKQYQKKQYSADFFCQKCSLIYYVEGQYKIDHCFNGCKIDSEKTFFGMPKSYLSLKARKNREKMIDLCGNDAIECIVLNQCCLEKENLKVLSDHFEKHLQKFKIPNIKSKVTCLLNSFKERKLNYSKKTYERLDTSKCIDPQLIEYNHASFNLGPQSNMQIRKYDMNNSYGSQLENLQLPYRDQGRTYLFDEANNLFEELTKLYKMGTFQFNGYGRAKILTPQNRYTKIIPFFGFFSVKDDTSYLALCHKCAILKCAVCNHSTKEKSFYVQSTLSSFLFAKCILNYDIDFTEILFFKSCKNYREIFEAFQSLSCLRL